LMLYCIYSALEARWQRNVDALESARIVRANATAVSVITIRFVQTKNAIKRTARAAIAVSGSAIRFRSDRRSLTCLPPFARICLNATSPLIHIVDFVIIFLLCGFSSVVRALPCHGRGQELESPNPHHGAYA
jgi:hypothetical protein